MKKLRKTLLQVAAELEKRTTAGNKEVEKEIKRIIQALKKELRHFKVDWKGLAEQLRSDLELKEGVDIPLYTRQLMKDIGRQKSDYGDIYYWARHSDFADYIEYEIPSSLVRQYEERAEAERDAGGSCDINERMPTVAVELSDGSDYFFQGEEADRLLASVPDNIDPEDFILAQAQDW